MKRSLDPDKLSCVCNGKPLREYADKINADGEPCCKMKLKHYYKCGNKCGKCIPYIKKMLTVPVTF